MVARVAELIRAGSSAMPGVREMLALCAQLGWRVGLASNSPAVLCQLVLHELGIDGSFHAVVSADHVEQGKPDPAIYLLAARMLGVEPRHCLVFEDSSTGVRAARAAGMSVVAIPSAGQSFVAAAALARISSSARCTSSTAARIGLWQALWQRPVETQLAQQELHHVLDGGRVAQRAAVTEPLRAPHHRVRNGGRERRSLRDGRDVVFLVVNDEHRNAHRRGRGGRRNGGGGPAEVRREALAQAGARRVFQA